jgi:hypothetical protein
MEAIEERHPKDNLAGKINLHISFNFIRDELAQLYSQDNGRALVGVLRLLKMMIENLFGISSELS